MRIRLLLLPFSFIFGIITWIRNKCFDWRVLKELSLNIPIISVGNITVGGTGKTPHVEYLANLLKLNYRLAVLSRGYKRTTKGFMLADSESTPNIIGDEPYQIYQKNTDIAVAVCEKRVSGLMHLLSKVKELSVVILDDAFQHRHIKPGLSILLIDYNRPIYKDFMLPAGELREYANGSKRANIVVVTKSPEQIDNKTIGKWRAKLRLESRQHLFFSKFQYEALTSAYDNTVKLTLEGLIAKKIIVIAGIANPKPFLEYLSEFGLNYHFIRFPDHNFFNEADVRIIKDKFAKYTDNKGIVLTTEKDAVRIMYSDLYPEELKQRTFYLPISVKILNNEQEKFNRLINKYVEEN